MDYSAFLKKNKLDYGNFVEVKTKDSAYQGYLIPHSESDTIMLKQTTGYNLGVKIANVVYCRKLDAGKKVGKPKTVAITHNPNLPTISILHTGGTVASRVDYSTGGVFASFTPEDLLTLFPELEKIANFRVRLVSNLMSEDMRFSHYKLIAKAVAEEAKKGVKGVIIGHGTDTLAYTSAALAFMLEGVNIPVILVGAQRSSDRGSSDAASNLTAAANFIAKTDFAGVAICMHESTGDESCVILPATKTRKMHTSRRDAFKAINDVPIARVKIPGGEVEWIKKDYQHKSVANKLVLRDKIEEKVAILRIHPNMHPAQFEFYHKNKFKGLVLEATGLGHTPTNIKEHEKNYKALEQLIKSGCVVVNTSQCLYGRVHTTAYTNLRRLSNIGVIGGEDMLPETAFVKLAWLLGNFGKVKAKELIAKNLRGEITETTKIDTYDLPSD